MIRITTVLANSSNTETSPMPYIIVVATPKDETLKDEGSKSQKLVKRRDEPPPEKLIVRKTKDEDEGADDAKSKLAPCHTYGCGMGRSPWPLGRPLEPLALGPAS